MTPADHDHLKSALMFHVKQSPARRLAFCLLPQAEGCEDLVEDVFDADPPDQSIKRPERRAQFLCHSLRFPRLYPIRSPRQSPGCRFERPALPQVPNQPGARCSTRKRLADP